MLFHCTDQAYHLGSGPVQQQQTLDVGSRAPGGPLALDGCFVVSVQGERVGRRGGPLNPERVKFSWEKILEGLSCAQLSGKRA